MIIYELIALFFILIFVVVIILYFKNSSNLPIILALLNTSLWLYIGLITISNSKIENRNMDKILYMFQQNQKLINDKINLQSNQNYISNMAARPDKLDRAIKQQMEPKRESWMEYSEEYDPAISSMIAEKKSVNTIYRDGDPYITNFNVAAVPRFNLTKKSNDPRNEIYNVESNMLSDKSVKLAKWRNDNKLKSINNAKLARNKDTYDKLFGDDLRRGESSQWWGNY